jgi:fibronectin type 3 domain-containing protein
VKNLLLLLLIISQLAVASWGLLPATSALTQTKSSNANLSIPSNSPFTYIIIILMENHALSNIYNDPSAPYETSLANTYSLATQYTALTHPSLPNYLGLTGASLFGVNTDCQPTDKSCNAGAQCCPITSPNIIDKINGAGLSWKAYAEDYPVSSGCYTGADAGAYVAHHFPFLYYSNIVNSPTSCNKLVKANSVTTSSNLENDDLLLNDLSSTSTASNFMWLTPNTCDDWHDSCTYSGDYYLSQLVPKILSSSLFKTQKAALLITYDEGVGTYPSDYVYTLWAGPVAKTGYKSSASYTHYSVLKTLETAWNLPALTTNDTAASSMSEFFTTSSSSNLPSNPSNLAANSGIASITLTWNAPLSNGGSPITGYSIYRGTAPNSESLLTKIANQTTYTDTSLPAGSTYYYQVTALNSNGESPPSNEASATTKSPPSPPLNLTATNGIGLVSLHWSPPNTSGGAPIGGYKLYRGTSSGPETAIVTLGVQLAYNDSSISGGTTYYYKITAINLAGESNFSNEASSTPASLPTSPLNLQATNSSGSVFLTWSAPYLNGSSPLTGYRIYRGVGIGAESLLTFIGAQTYYNDSSINAGTIYYYRVSAVSAVGEGPLSNEAINLLTSTPTPPRNLQTVGGQGQITLTWTVPSSNGGSSIAGYMLYRGTTSGAETFLTTLDTTQLTYRDTSVAGGVTYYYELRAINGNGAGLFSNEAYAMPTSSSISAPGTPGNPLATAGASSITIIWSPPTTNGGAAIIGYKLYRGTAAGGENSTPIAIIANMTVYIDNSTTPGVTYYYTIKATNAAGDSVASSEVSATIFANPLQGLAGNIDWELYALPAAGLLLIGFGVYILSAKRNGVDQKKAIESTDK